MRFSFLLRLLTIVSLLHTGRGMYSKRHLGEDYEKADVSKRLRTNLAALYCQNDISGQRAASSFADAHAAGAAHLDDLCKIKPDSHAQRNLIRRFHKKTKHFWPPLYYASIRVFDKTKQKTVRAWCPMFFPHELVYFFA